MADREPAPLAAVPAQDDAAGVAFAEIRITRAWNLRGDLGRGTLAAESQALFGVQIPLQPGTSTYGAGGAMLWLGPRSWLWVAGTDAPAPDFDAARRARNAAGGALFDLSASYVAREIRGEAAARVLNRGCPLDFHSRVFSPGHCAQSVFGHINALFYRPDERPAYIVMVARSIAADAWHDLWSAAMPERPRVAPAFAFGAAPDAGSDRT
ncbi:MAG TPA: hypothetical protein VGV08_09950 [Casimicrobiaceae bacterium]|nr:hypothetical protein [Casimicrobiaceae bacterium]